MPSEVGCELQTMQHNMAAFASHIAQSATQHIHNQIYFKLLGITHLIASHLKTIWCQARRFSGVFLFLTFKTTTTTIIIVIIVITDSECKYQVLQFSFGIKPKPQNQ
jgi:hypothetical protein